MSAKSIMIQGTTSDAGKSTVAVGLCRLIKRQGISVAPFKPQNMALNSAVTADGGEIGRAQALQAFACGIEPHTDMNPVLLKPSTNSGAQVIVNGKIHSVMNAHEYHQNKPLFLPFILDSYRRLASQYDRVVVEGAGSPAEINLRTGDLANMGFAEAVDCPVILVADIDRGGVFAHIAGTLALLSNSEQQRIRGVIINKFRGDLSLLKPGIDWLEEHTGKPVLGVLPFMEQLVLDAEDSLNSRTVRNSGVAKKSGDSQDSLPLRVVVPALPRLSNFTDLQPLLLHHNVELSQVSAGEVIPHADLVILPGSKSVVADLSWLRANGWQEYILRHLRYGGKLLGICGGFQMLGHTLLDPFEIESKQRAVEGLALLDFQTELQTTKILRQVRGKLNISSNAQVSGYEIHMGISAGPALSLPFVVLPDRIDGAISQDGQIMGTYLHGIFDQPDACRELLVWAGLRDAASIDYNAVRNDAIDRVADSLAANLNIELIEQIFSNSGSVVLRN